MSTETPVDSVEKSVLLDKGMMKELLHIDNNSTEHDIFQILSRVKSLLLDSENIPHNQVGKVEEEQETDGVARDGRQRRGIISAVKCNQDFFQ